MQIIWNQLLALVNNEKQAIALQITNDLQQPFQALLSMMYWINVYSIIAGYSHALTNDVCTLLSQAMLFKTFEEYAHRGDRGGNFPVLSDIDSNVVQRIQHTVQALTVQAASQPKSEACKNNYILYQLELGIQKLYEQQLLKEALSKKEQFSYGGSSSRDCFFPLVRSTNASGKNEELSFVPQL